jgi:ABC-type transporter Mla MlaB component
VVSTDAAVTSASLPGSIVIQPELDRLTLCLSGEIDGAVVASFTHRLSDGGRPAAEPTGEPAGLPAVAAIDAGAVTFIDSAGLVFLVRCLQASQTAGRPLVLRASSPSLDRVLARTALTELFSRPASVRPEPGGDGNSTAPLVYTAWRRASTAGEESAGAAHALTVGAGRALCGAQVSSVSTLPWPPTPQQIQAAVTCPYCSSLAA